MPFVTALRPFLFAAAVVAIAAPAAAQGLRPSAAYVQAGGGDDGVHAAASVGAIWDWSWRRPALGGEFTGATELVGTLLQAERVGATGNRTYAQLGLVPMLRWRPDGGRSPWFGEIGIGLSIMDRKLETPNKTQGSAWNFHDNLAVGRSFGARNEHELSLRWQHTSNAGLKKPNPGFDMFFVRWTERF